MELIDDIPKRARALREAQVLWMKELNTRREAEQEWREKSPDAYDLRDNMIHAFRYAYRKHPDILERISAIDEDYSHADMIQDLNNLAVLGKANPDPLTAIGFDQTLFDQAAQMSDEMADLLGRANGEKGSNQSARIIRDRAYPHLKEGIDEIRECGKYLFWRDEERLKGYSSAYLRRMNKRKGKSRETEETEDAAGIT